MAMMDRRCNWKHTVTAIQTVKKPGHEWHEWREEPPWECDFAYATWAASGQQSGGNLPGKRPQAAHLYPAPEVFSREIAARLLQREALRPCGVGKIADHRPALR